MGVIPNNTGGLSDVVKAAQVFVRNELTPLQERIEEVNDLIREEVIRFKPCELNPTEFPPAFFTLAFRPQTRHAPAHHNHTQAQRRPLERAQTLIKLNKYHASVQCHPRHACPLNGSLLMQVHQEPRER